MALPSDRASVAPHSLARLRPGTVGVPLAERIGLGNLAVLLRANAFEDPGEPDLRVGFWRETGKHRTARAVMPVRDKAMGLCRGLRGGMATTEFAIRSACRVAM